MIRTPVKRWLKMLSVATTSTMQPYFNSPTIKGSNWNPHQLSNTLGSSKTTPWASSSLKKIPTLTPQAKIVLWARRMRNYLVFWSRRPKLYPIKRIRAKIKIGDLIWKPYLTRKLNYRISASRCTGNAVSSMGSWTENRICYSAGLWSRYCSARTKIRRRYLRGIVNQQAAERWPTTTPPSCAWLRSTGMCREHGGSFQLRGKKSQLWWCLTLLTIGKFWKK